MGGYLYFSFKRTRVFFQIQWQIQMQMQTQMQMQFSLQRFKKNLRGRVNSHISSHLLFIGDRQKNTENYPDSEGSFRIFSPW